MNKIGSKNLIFIIERNYIAPRKDFTAEINDDIVDIDLGNKERQNKLHVPKEEKN